MKVRSRTRLIELRASSLSVFENVSAGWRPGFHGGSSSSGSQAASLPTVLKWRFLAVAAMISAGIPTRLSSHGLAVGFPFSWRTRQEIITLGEQPHNFSLWLLVVNALLVLTVFVALWIAIN